METWEKDKKCEVLDHNWQLTGDLKKKNFHHISYSFLKWILLGPRIPNSNNKEQTPENDNLLQTQLRLYLRQSLKSDLPVHDLSFTYESLPGLKLLTLNITARVKVLL